MSYYTTLQGECWDEIAYKVYGDCGMCAALMWANRNWLTIHRFPAGVELELPEQEAYVSAALPPWKRGAT